MEENLNNSEYALRSKCRKSGRCSSSNSSGLVHTPCHRHRNGHGGHGHSHHHNHLSRSPSPDGSSYIFTMKESTSNLVGPPSSGEDDMISDKEEEDALTVTNESFISAKTNATRLSTFSRTSQKSIQVLTSVYQSATSMLTSNNNNVTSNVEILYPRVRSSTSISSVQTKNSQSILEEEFRAKSRESAAITSKLNYDSDEGEEDLIDDEEEETHYWSIFYDRVLRISKFVWRWFINLTCVPIYWILVQTFVLEKWLLNRSPPAPPSSYPVPPKGTPVRNIAPSAIYNGVPYHDCRPTRSPVPKLNGFAVSVQQTKDWTKTLARLLLLLLALAVLGLVGFGLKEVVGSLYDRMTIRKENEEFASNIIVPPEIDFEGLKEKLAIHVLEAVRKENKEFAAKMTVPQPQPPPPQIDIERLKTELLNHVLQTVREENQEFASKLTVPPAPPPEIDIGGLKKELLTQVLETVREENEEFAAKMIVPQPPPPEIDIEGLKEKLTNHILEAVREENNELVSKMTVPPSPPPEIDIESLKEKLAHYILTIVQGENKEFASKMIVPSPPAPEIDIEALKEKLENHILTIVREELQKVSSKTAASVPPPPPGPEIDIEALREDLTKYLVSTIRQECKDCASMMTTTAAENSDVHRIVKLAIAKYDADKTGIADLALEPAGGSVVSTRCTKSSVKRTSVYTFFGLPFWHPPNNPRTIIQPGAVPGECWSYEGAEGFIVIQLIAPSIVHGFTLEHIPKALSPFGHIESAPKNFQVVGLMDYNNVETEFLFGSYTYEDNGEPIQYFPVQFESKQAFPFIELKIQSNHGSIEFTCVYRFRVHGQLTNSKSVPVEFKEPITYPDPV